MAMHIVMLFVHEMGLYQMTAWFTSGKAQVCVGCWMIHSYPAVGGGGGGWVVGLLTIDTMQSYSRLVTGDPPQTQ